MDLTWKIFVFVLGLCLGSFLNVVIYRLPREDVGIGEPKRSVCPKCNAHISWYDNLPIISYLILLGRCRHCKTVISPRYPIVELMCGLLTLAVFLKFGLSFRFFAVTYFVLALVAITYIDLDEMIIPDHLTVPGMIIGLAAAAIQPDATLIGAWGGTKLLGWGLHSLRWWSIIGSAGGMLIGGGIVWLIFNLYFIVRGEEGIGGGDSTLLAMIGAFLGWRAVLVTIFMGSILALVAALIMSIKAGEFNSKMKLPFGPFLSMAALINLFFGEQLLRWYLG